MKRNGGVDSLHDELLERALHLGDGFVAIDAVDDELRDERVIVGRYDAFGVLRGIDADAVAAGNIEGGDLAGGWRELDRVLGVDAALDGVAADLDLLAEECR